MFEQRLVKLCYKCFKESNYGEKVSRTTLNRGIILIFMNPIVSGDPSTHFIIHNR